jgi:hypothetical protein
MNQRDQRPHDERPRRDKDQCAGGASRAQHRQKSICAIGVSRFRAHPGRLLLATSETVDHRAAKIKRIQTKSLFRSTAPDRTNLSPGNRFPR